MAQKTNKSFRKRLKVTKTGKVLTRKPGQNHFRAKDKRSKQLSKKRFGNLDIKHKTLKQNLPHG